MTRAEMITHICDQLQLNRHQARSMVNTPGEWNVLRATYPGGAPNPIIGYFTYWPYARYDEQWRVTREGSNYSIQRVDLP